MGLTVYLVFARKYRPLTFDEVVGQSHIARTLQNAVKADRVAHAYLFCGSRGVGKTTMARILAKALNCAAGPTPEPCGECESCRRIATGDDLDVMEIDGASNRGIEEIRQLRQNVNYAPAHSKFKVYYIDEVHMLTGPAFNALLKTLEEPPAHVKFIFSTTDPQQLPDTVKSRCQRFDFRRISEAEIITHLQGICGKEQIAAQKGALPTIARAARGSLRDALGVLDQVAAFREGELRTEDVLSVLGAVNTDTLVQTIDALAEGRTGEALGIVHRTLFSGVDVLDFADQFSQYVRDLLVASYCGAGDELLAGSAADEGTLERQAGLFSTDQLLYMLQVLREARLRARRDTCGRLALEMAIVKLSRLDDLIPLQQALSQPGSPGSQASGDEPGAGASGRQGLGASKPRGSAPGSSQPERKEGGTAPERSRSVQGILEKLQNRAEPKDSSEEEEEASPAEGIGAAKFRQIQKAADDREALSALQDEKPLLDAFKEADRQFGLQPLRLKMRKDKGNQQKDDSSPQPA